MFNLANVVIGRRIEMRLEAIAIGSFVVDFLFEEEHALYREGYVRVALNRKKIANIHFQPAVLELTKVALHKGAS